MDATFDAPAASAAADAIVFPWLSDQGDGTFRNPILCSDYSDPDVIRHGDDFYLTASSFNCTPGLPILHSKDLVNWALINHAVKKLPDPRYAEVQHGCGVWAPSIRFHAGKFWIFFAMPDEGIYVTTAAHPSGEWSVPHLVQPGKGLIDPCPFWDDDGKAYLVHAYAGSRAGIKHRLRVCPMAADGSKLLGEGEIVFHNPDRHPTLEGPKFFKKDGWYYIFAPAGGVETGWQVVLRSKNIFGPYEDRIVLEQGRTPINGPHQGALVDTPGGGHWFVHFQDAGVYGRVTHLQPVVWNEGWPLIGRDHDGNGIGEPVSRHPKPVSANGARIALQTSDEFDSPRLGLQWQWHANHRDDWYSLSGGAGRLRLFPQFVAAADLTKAPNLLLQKFPARSFAVETKLEFSPGAVGEETGLVVMGHKHAAVCVRQTGQGAQVIFRKNGHDHPLEIVSAKILRFRVEVRDGGLCHFSFAVGEGNFTRIREIFQAQRGAWLGAKVGIYSLQPGRNSPGCSDFDYFRFLAVQG
jgi:beta-xylosidase